MTIIQQATTEIEMEDKILFYGTVLGGVAAFGYFLEKSFGWIAKLKLFLIFFHNKKSTYLKSTVRLKSVEGDFDTFSDGVKLKYLKLKYPNNPSLIQVYFSQISLRLVANYGDDARIYLPYEFDRSFYHTGEGALEKRTNKYVLSIVDINEDKTLEVLFAVIDQDLENELRFKIQINVFQYHPPANKNDILRDQNWTLIGNLRATGHGVEPVLEISSRSIRVITHFQGFCHEWHYVKGEFIDKGEN